MPGRRIPAAAVEPAGAPREAQPSCSRSLTQNQHSLILLPRILNHSCRQIQMPQPWKCHPPTPFWELEGAAGSAGALAEPHCL